MSAPRPPRPDKIRQPDRGFSWIDQRFRHFWEDLSREELLLYFFLVTTANPEGLSWYSVRKICKILKIGPSTLIRARETLEQRLLIATEKDEILNRTIYQVLALPIDENERIEIPIKPRVQKQRGGPARGRKKETPAAEEPAEESVDQHKLNMKNLERMKDFLKKI